MLRALVALALVVCGSAQGKTFIIGGHEAAKADYPEILYMIASKAGQSWACSGTVVGPSVFLTAAHCADDGQVVKGYAGGWQAVCSRHPSYKDSDNDHAVDISVCKRSDGKEWSIKPAVIGQEGPAVGDIVTLAGYGCTSSSRRGGNNGVLKVGEGKVVELDAVNDYWYYTDGKDAICSGDSGGPSYKRIKAPRRDVHEVIGVNSRGDLRSVSLMVPLYIDLSREFLLDFAQKNQVKICGVSDDCQ